jgi:hypothetical protein
LFEISSQSLTPVLAQGTGAFIGVFCLAPVFSLVVSARETGLLQVRQNVAKMGFILDSAL